MTLCTSMCVAFACQVLANDLWSADSFRCGRKIIRTGDTPAEVLERCGTPRYRDKAEASIKVAGSTRAVRVERWYYKGSARRLGRVVLIHAGRVVDIQTGQR